VAPAPNGQSDPEGIGEPLSAEDLGRALRRQPEMVEALDRMWPLLTPEQFLHDLLGARPLIELAAGKTLSRAERDLLYRPRTPAGVTIAWTDADVPLLDEAHWLLGSRRRGAPDSAETVRTYGHVVVDEAQDVSPMQLRMVARRSLSGSMTVVGDIAQATGSWVPASWAQVVEHLPARRGWRLVELTVNYRTPSEIMDVATRVLEQVAPGMRPAESVRASGSQPRILTATRNDGILPRDTMMALTVQAVKSEMGELSILGPSGTVAVIVPPSLFNAVAGALDSSRIPYGYVGRGALDETVTLLTIEDAKGLEFDSVTVVEPHRIVNETAQGLRALYVAFTRATQRLVIVHAEALPAPLAGVAQHSA
jgi:superfamily I DNA/RNA helicase